MAKWLSEEPLQIAEKRREGKGKGEKELYTHLNAEFQRIARRDKKAFLSEKHKEMQKRLSKESLPIAEKRREAKGKGEREGYTQTNAEFQRIARRDKKAFLGEMQRNRGKQ